MNYFFFEPGDGTRYHCAFFFLTPDECHAASWGGPACFFGFGAASRPLSGGTLPTDRACDAGYFNQQVGDAISCEWTRHAAYLAYCELIGQRPLNPFRTADDLRWKTTWRAQLAPTAEQAAALLASPAPAVKG